MPMLKCKKILAWFWCISSTILILILFFQTFSGRYGEHAREAWVWLMPNIMPTLGLIISTLVKEINRIQIEKNIGNSTLFKLTLFLSVFYFLLIVLTIILGSFKQGNPLVFYHLSSLWLGPIQGLLAAAMGGFFTEEHNETN